MGVLLAGGPAQACALAAAMDMHASEGAVSSEPAVSSGVGAAGDPVASNAAAMHVHVSEGTVSSEPAVGSGVGAALSSMCSRRKRTRGKQPAKEICARVIVCMLISAV